MITSLVNVGTAASVIEIAGLGLSATGVGTEIGIPLALGGKILGIFTTSIEIKDAYQKGDMTTATTKGAIMFGSEVVGGGLGKLATKPVEKAIVGSGGVIGTKVIEEAVKKPDEDVKKIN